jgi:dolichol kinase
LRGGEQVQSFDFERGGAFFRPLGQMGCKTAAAISREILASSFPSDGRRALLEQEIPLQENDNFMIPLHFCCMPNIDL